MGKSAALGKHLVVHYPAHISLQRDLVDVEVLVEVNITRITIANLQEYLVGSTSIAARFSMSESEVYTL